MKAHYRSRHKQSPKSDVITRPAMANGGGLAGDDGGMSTPVGVSKKSAPRRLDRVSRKSGKPTVNIVIAGKGNPPPPPMPPMAGPPPGPMPPPNLPPRNPLGQFARGGAVKGKGK